MPARRCTLGATSCTLRRRLSRGAGRPALGHLGRQPGTGRARAAAPTRFEGSSTFLPIASSDPASGVIVAVRLAPVRASCWGSAWWRTSSGGAARSRPRRRSRWPGRRWRPSACRRRRSAGRRSRPAAQTSGTAQLAATACSRSTSPARSNTRKEPLSASTAVIRRSRCGHASGSPSGVPSREPIGAEPLGRRPRVRLARRRPSRARRPRPLDGSIISATSLSIVPAPKSAPISACAGGSAPRRGRRGRPRW